MSQIILKLAKYTTMTVGSVTLLSVGAISLFSIGVNRSLKSSGHFENDWFIVNKTTNGTSWTFDMKKKQ